MKSIRVYLIILLLSTICIVNFSAALNGYKLSTQAGDAILDERLITMSNTILKLHNAYGILSAETFGENSIFQVWQGNVLKTRSSNAPLKTLTTQVAGFYIINSAEKQWRIHILKQHDMNLTIIYGEQYNLHRKFIEAIVLKSILPIIWVLPIIGLIIWFVTGRGLRPLKDFAEKLQRRSAGDLKLITNESLPNELSVISDSTNALFLRLTDAFEREKRMAADAAHELRTPLAALKINIHNLLQDGDGTNEHLLDLEDSAKRMENAIEKILILNQLTKEAFAYRLNQCELLPIIQTVASEMYSSLETKEQSIEIHGSEIMLDGDPFSLSLAIKNLLENAHKYGPSKGKIEIKSYTDRENVVIKVEDSGGGISSDNHAVVFDRFYRVGRDQNNSGVVGSGLGLSIVKQVVDLHNGTIMLGKSDKLGGLAVTLTLPKRQGGVAEGSV